MSASPTPQTPVNPPNVVKSAPDESASQSAGPGPQKVSRVWRRYWDAFSAVLFPPCCSLCGEPVIELFDPSAKQSSSAVNSGLTERAAAEWDQVDLRHEMHGRVRVFCRSCDAAISESRPMMQTACDACGWPIVQPRPDEVHANAGHPSPSALPCPRCSRLEKPFGFQRITPLYRYRGVVSDVVVLAKYPANATATRELAQRLAVAAGSRWPDLRLDAAYAEAGTDLTVPLVTHVPSPRGRQAHRGGSGTRLLARFFAKELGWVHADLLRTTRPMVKQAWLEDEQRRENVQDAFAIRIPWPWRTLGRSRLTPETLLQGREIILIDDVMTTGATANEISRVLLEAGAKRVSLAVVALAMREH
ncbi:Predicted amidophosphoribosyltransferases [Neorhodopirellula lusitana]|uniref:Predicted amidophosphoribosyltransferases n=1 Tax=Neorhodopirellula lusitana TaxID=445327 RepID=A0ABY1Q1V1_9BACT|nr:phosphoribosyltransferase family protein [Neorhodopirellula lusitana]SMP56087.1 Predicted amidophosphoribosyltransferases [Neorhodopirellula lusitana]